MVAPQYPKGDLRRMLAVLGAIDAGHKTLVQIVAATQAVGQACVSISKTGAMYTIEAWGPVLKKEGAKKALTGALNAPIIQA
jgi:hypothetical protein